MTPEHHEERLCAWAEKTGKPVLSLDYGKAPECECSLLYFTSTPLPMCWIPIGVFLLGVWEHSKKSRSPRGQTLCYDYLSNSDRAVEP